jgi:hypothetical protein
MLMNVLKTVDSGNTARRPNLMIFKDVVERVPAGVKIAAVAAVAMYAIHKIRKMRQDARFTETRSDDTVFRRVRSGSRAETETVASFDNVDGEPIFI